MADNFVADSGSGGDTFGADDITGVKYPRCKIIIGADGTNDGDVSSANPMPSVLTAGTAEIGKLAAGTAEIGNVKNSGTFAVQSDTTLQAETTKVIGTVNVAAAQTIAVTNAGTFATQATLQAGTAEIGKLAAGTATIGKMGANSGVDIGDVDVTSIANGSLNGPAAPTIDSYTNIAINLTTGADQSLVAAPGASKQIWVYGVGFSCDTAATTVSFQDEDDTAISGVMSFAQYGGLNSAPAGNFAMPMWKVATNKALEVDITTGDVDGWLAYGIVSV